MLYNCLGFQWVPLAPAGPSVWCLEGLHHGAVLFNDELRRLCHDVPPHTGAICHQTLHHLQYVRGTVTSLSFLAAFFFVIFVFFINCFCCQPFSRSLSFLQVADRLFSSFGQDILDALYWTATEPKEKKRAPIGVIPHFLMAVLYVCILTPSPKFRDGSWHNDYILHTPFYLYYY